MKVYAQFLTTDLKGRVSEACGSDGVLILDGRNSLLNQAAVAREQINRLHAVQPHYIGFQIIRAERFTDNGHVLYKTHDIGDPVLELEYTKEQGQQLKEALRK